MLVTDKSVALSTTLIHVPIPIPYDRSFVECETGGFNRLANEACDPVRQFKISNSVLCPFALSTLGETAYGNEIEDQRGTTSLCATDSLITNASLDALYAVGVNIAQASTHCVHSLMVHA